MGHGFGYFLLTASDDGVSFIAAVEPVTEWRQLDKQERERRVTKLRAHPLDQLFIIRSYMSGCAASDSP